MLDEFTGQRAGQALFLKSRVNPDGVYPANRVWNAKSQPLTSPRMNPATFPSTSATKET